MIKYTHGDILKADVQAIVNTVNCVGVMGRGIALQFKKAWPENFEAYANACKKKLVNPGKIFLFETQQLTNPQFIINFPTKRHWRGASRMEDIEAGLEDLLNVIEENEISSIAIPPLGAGLGGLNWTEVKARIENALSSLVTTEVLIFEPKGTPEQSEIVKNRIPPKITPGRAVLVELIQRYLKGLLDPSISLIEVHKLMYFMQVAGEPLRLKYSKGHYGPYAENLRHVLNAIEGHMVSGYADGGDEPDKMLELVPGAADEANRFLVDYPETIDRFEKVSRLVEGFESSFGLELLSTVHWVKMQEKAEGNDETVEAIHSWNQKKKKFTPRQIEIASNVLTKNNWM